MGRYTGAKHRVSRRFAENLWGTKKSPLATKPYKPGQHGRDGRRGKMSNYNRGMLEKQTMMQMLERRLDNIVYRLGFAPTNRAARQLVAHGHIEVNGKKVDRASFIVDVGDKVAVRQGSKAHIQVQEAISAKPDVVSYLRADHEKIEGELLQIPRRKDIPVIANERLVIEFLGR